MISYNCAWMNGWVNNRKADDLRRHRAHYDVIVMESLSALPNFCDEIIVVSRASHKLS